MQFNVPLSEITFEIPDEWWKIANMTTFSPSESHYRTADACPAVVLLDSVAPPLRDGGTVWFRNQETVLELIACIRDDLALPPSKFGVRVDGTLRLTTWFVMDSTVSTSALLSGSLKFRSKFKTLT